MLKRIGLFAIVTLAFYAALLLNSPSETVKSFGYNSILNLYAEHQLHENKIKILYNPGLRSLNFDPKHAKIIAYVPQQGMNCQQVMEDFLHSGGQAIVECSALDGWHSSTQGCWYLSKLRAKAYRVVIFDGGHHLPTLGMAPDIIIVPEYKGYAAHGYMRDALNVNALLEMLRENKSPSILVSVSRWRLVKSENSLKGITQQILNQLNVRQTASASIRFNCVPRISKFNEHVYIYINQYYAENPGEVVRGCRSLGLDPIKKIFVAFDYNIINQNEAVDYTRNLQRLLGRNVYQVNDPIKVPDLIFSR